MSRKYKSTDGLSANKSKQALAQVLASNQVDVNSVFKNMLNGFALCRIEVDPNHQPIDFTYLDINESFERITGLKRKDVVGKRVTEVIPGIRESSANLFEIYGKVALTGEKIQFDLYFEPLAKWLTISAYSPKPGFFVALFEDITEHRQAEERILHLNSTLRTIRNVNQLLVREKDRDRLIQKTCELLVETRDYAVAWILLVDQHQQFVSAASAGVKEARILIEQLKRGKYPSCVSAVLKQAAPFAVYPDTQSHQDCVLSKLDACALVGRLEHQNWLYGIMAVGLPQSVAVDKEEQGLFREMLGDIAYGLAGIEQEQALEASEARFRDLYDNAPIAYYSSNASGVIIDCNQAGCELLGYSREEFLGRPRLSLFAAESASKAKELFEKLLRGISTEGEELVFLSKDGRKVYGLVSMSAIRDESGKFVASRSIVRDITDRKKIEAALRESEENFRNSLENSPMGISIFTPDYDLIYANQALLDLYGYSSFEEMKATPIKDRRTPESYLEYLERREKIRRGEYMPDRYDLAIVRQDGQIRNLEAVRREVVWNGKKEFQVICQDVTERKKAAAALRESEQNFRNSLDNSPLGISILTADSDAIYANRALLDLYGYSTLEELKAVPLKDRRTPESYLITLERREKRRRGEYVPEKYEMAIVRQDGQIRNVEEIRREVVWNGKKEFQVIYQDVTERKRAEEEIRRLLDRESQVAREWQETFDAVTDIVMLISPHHELLRINRAGCEATGKKPEELIGKKCYEVVHGLGAPIEQCPCVQALKTKKSHTSELTELGRHYLLMAYPIFDKDGEIESFAHIVKDVTERKQAEAALRESEENFRNSLENSPLPIFILNHDDEMIYANRALIDLHGYPTFEELKAVPLKDRRTPESYGEYLERGEKRRRGEYVPDRYEIAIVRQDGQIRNLDTVRREVVWNGKKEFQVIYQDVTERKKADAALRESEQNFHNSIDNSPLGIRIVTGDGDLLYANQAILNMYGYSTIHELEHTPLKQRYTPESTAEHLKRKEKREHGEYVPARYGINIVRKDGEVRCLEVVRQGIRWASNQVFQVIYQDVTEHRKADAEIASLAKFPSQNPNPVLRARQDGTIIYANESSSRLLRKWKTDVGKNLPRRYREILVKALRSASVQCVELEIGGINYLLTIVPIIEDGYVNLYAFNITQRKQAEQKLRISQEKLRSMFESMTEGVVVLDMEANIQEVNKAALRMYGSRTRRALVGRNAFEIIAERDRDRMRNNMDKGLQAGALRNIECNIIANNGKEFPAQLNTAILRDASGKPFGTIVMVEDITERKWAEGKAREADALNRYDQLRRDFLANVSHELRTPLTSIKGFTGTMLRKDVKWSEKDQRDFLESIDRETDRLTRLISDILDTSRLEAGAFKPERSQCYITEIIDSVSARLLILAESHKLEISVPAGLPPVFIDAMRIGQVLSNLVENAAKFSAGETPIRIEVKADGARLIISVADKGRGMSGEVIGRLFDRFYQAERVVDEGKGGTGLGLYICRGIVEAHGGKIWVDSQVGQGSTFYLSLPLSGGESNEPNQGSHH